MTSNDTYLFDTYAVISIVKNNKNYIPYQNKNIVLTKLNLFEIYYILLGDYGEAIATAVYDDYKYYSVTIGNSILQDAARLKLSYKKRNLSMTDCICYILARKMGIKFLTGDKQFKDLSDVEFIQ